MYLFILLHTVYVENNSQLVAFSGVIKLLTFPFFVPYSNCIHLSILRIYIYGFILWYIKSLQFLLECMKCFHPPATISSSLLDQPASSFF